MLALGAAKLVVAASVVGMGLPFGFPAANQDPVMMRVAPEQCIAFLTWAEAGDPAEGKLPTEKLLAEPEMQIFLKELDRAIEAAVQTNTADAPAEQKYAATQAHFWTRFILMHSASVFLESVEMKPEGPDVRGGAVVSLGDSAGLMAAMIDKVRADLIPGVAEEVEIDGNKMFRVIPPDPGAPQFIFGIKGKYLLIGMGEGSIEGILKRVASPAPMWLTQLRDTLEVENPSILVHVNTKKIWELAKPMIEQEEPDGPQIVAMMEGLGFSEVSHVTLACGLDDQGVLTRSLVGLAGEPRGLFALLKDQGLTAKDLSVIPADAQLAVGGCLDANKLYELILSAVDSLPGAREEFERELAIGEKELGVKLQDDFLKPLGDRWRIYQSPSEGGWMAGWGLCVSVDDRATLAAAVAKLVAVAQREEEAGGEYYYGPRLREFQFQGQQVYYCSSLGEMMPFAPAWCITENELWFSLFPQNIKSVLSRGKGFASLADLSAVKEALSAENPPAQLTYQDTTAMFQLMYPMMSMGGRMAALQGRREGFDFESAAIPSGRSILRHITPDISTVNPTPDGLLITSHQSIPGNSVLPFAAMAVVGLMEQRSYKEEYYEDFGEDSIPTEPVPEIFREDVDPFGDPMPGSDPFGEPEESTPNEPADPFGPPEDPGPGGSDDPFGGSDSSPDDSDPFGPGDPGDAPADPFGDPPSGAGDEDPFGSSDDPFADPSAPDDPFADPPAGNDEDPFADP